jgi:hypothetical protein
VCLRAVIGLLMNQPFQRWDGDYRSGVLFRRSADRIFEKYGKLLSSRSVTPIRSMSADHTMIACGPPNAIGTTRTTW